MARQGDDYRLTIRRRGRLCGGKNLVERAVGGIVWWRCHDHNIFIQPFVDRLPKGEDAAGQTNNDKDGAQKEADIVDGPSPKVSGR